MDSFFTFIGIDHAHFRQYVEPIYYGKSTIECQYLAV